MLGVWELGGFAELVWCFSRALGQCYPARLQVSLSCTYAMFRIDGS